MSKEQIMPISHETNAPQLIKKELQKKSVNHLLSNIKIQTEINQIISCQINGGMKQAKETKK